MTVMLAPLPSDLYNLATWVGLVLAVTAALYGIGWGMDRAFAKMREEDTPEPKRREHLNAVIRFPSGRRIQ